MIKEFWKCYSEAVNVGKAQGHMLSKMDMLDNKPVNLVGFSLGTLAAYYTAINVKSKNKICDLYLLGSVLDKNEFLGNLWSLIGRGGTVEGRIYIDYSKSDWVLWSLKYLKLVKDKKFEEPIGHYGITHKEIADYFLKKNLISENEYKGWLNYAKAKIMIIDVSDKGIGHTYYESRYDFIIKR